MFPVELKRMKNWVCYTWPNKEPINPLTGKFAASDDSSTWGTYEQAVTCMRERNLPGVGFMFEPPYIGIDLDDCIENGIINDFAKNIVSKCNSYTEYSPSKTGIHIIVKGVLPKAIKRKEIEVYTKCRFFTVTNKPLFPVRPIKSIDVSSVVPNEVLSTELYTENWISEVLKNVTNGTRNNDFARVAGSLRNRGYGPADIFSLLAPKAREVGFGDAELKTICDSIGRYSPATYVDNGAASSIDQFLADQQNVEWLVPGMIAQKSIGFFAGLPESKKTWLMIDLAIQVAKGGIWLNKFPVKQGKVLFVDQERFKGETQRRFKAVIQAQNISLASLSPRLSVRCGSTTRLNLQPSFDAFKKQLSELRPDLVIVDTLASFHTAEENNRQSIQEVLERVKELRNEFGCTFLFIHHENKFAFDKEQEPSISQMAGSIAIPAAAETVFTVRKQDNDSSMVYNTKNTLAQTVPPFLVKVTDMDDEKTKIKVEAF